MKEPAVFGIGELGWGWAGREGWLSQVIRCRLFVSGLTRFHYVFRAKVCCLVISHG